MDSDVAFVQVGSASLIVVVAQFRSFKFVLISVSSWVFELRRIGVEVVIVFGVMNRLIDEFGVVKF